MPQWGSNHTVHPLKDGLAYDITRYLCGNTCCEGLHIQKTLSNLFLLTSQVSAVIGIGATSIGVSCFAVARDSFKLPFTNGHIQCTCIERAFGVHCNILRASVWRHTFRNYFWKHGNAVYSLVDWRLCLGCRLQQPCTVARVVCRTTSTPTAAAAAAVASAASADGRTVVMTGPTLQRSRRNHYRSHTQCDRIATRRSPGLRLRGRVAGWHHADIGTE